MSRREYDFENGDTSLDALMKAINEQKANFGGDSMYIELARKFDNSDYQWVIYRSTIVEHAWDVLTSGYFVLFRLKNRGLQTASAEVVKSMSFSGLYLSQGLSQCVTTCTSKTSTTISAYTYIHAYLFAPVSTTRYKTAYLRTYGVELQTYTSNGKVISTSDVSLKNTTSTTIGNYVNNNSFIHVVTTTSAVSIKWYNSSANSSGAQGPVLVTINITNIYSTSPSVASTVNGPSAGTQVRCQLLLYYNVYRWITWLPDANGHDVTSSMGFTTSTNSTGWSRSTTAVSPFAGRYYMCYYFPIWTWTTPTSSTTTYVNQNNNCLWWLTKESEKDNYLERKFMMSSLTTLTPTTTSENQDYYRVWNGSSSNNYPSMFGLMTMDGKLIYTLNVNTKLLEKIDTKVR